MYKHGYLKVALASPKVYLGKPMENAIEIVNVMNKSLDASIICFPELSLTGARLGDWHKNREILNEQKLALNYIVKNSSEQIVIVGGSFEYLDNLYDVAYVIQDGSVLGIVPKISADNEDHIFEEAYQFYDSLVEVELFGELVPFGNVKFINSFYNISFSVEIGEDFNTINDTQLVFNLNSCGYYLNKNNEFESLVKATSIKNRNCYLLTSINTSETASNVLYNGQMVGYTAGEKLISKTNTSFTSNVEYVDVDLDYIKFERMNKHFVQAESEYFVEFSLEETDDYYLTNIPSKEPFVINSKEEAEEIIDVICASLYHRLSHIGLNKVVIGVSGGLDSCLAILMAHRCFTKYSIPVSNILAYSMPALATGSKSQQIALDLMNGLGVKATVLPIGNEIKSHFDLINHDENEKNTTYENAQARYRTLVLMNISNSEHAIVLGTGDMSEIALGWSTFNGDQMSMYNINAGLPKTAIRSLVAYFAKTMPNLSFVLTDIINATITPELVSSSQATEDIIGKYEINDFILHQIFARGASMERVIYLVTNLFNLDDEVAKKYYNNFLRRFKQNQFKRIASPEGVKIFKLSLSPHGALKFYGDVK